jgi:hypothetical protein
VLESVCGVAASAPPAPVDGGGWSAPVDAVSVWVAAGAASVGFGVVELFANDRRGLNVTRCVANKLAAGLLEPAAVESCCVCGALVVVEVVERDLIGKLLPNRARLAEIGLG